MATAQWTSTALLTTDRNINHREKKQLAGHTTLYAFKPWLHHQLAVQVQHKDDTLLAKKCIVCCGK
jgi:hypothetical protein